MNFSPRNLGMSRPPGYITKFSVQSVRLLVFSLRYYLLYGRKSLCVCVCVILDSIMDSYLMCRNLASKYQPVRDHHHSQQVVQSSPQQHRISQPLQLLCNKLNSVSSMGYKCYVQFGDKSMSKCQKCTRISLQNYWHLCF